MTDDREVRPQRRVEALLDLWVLVPVVVLCRPLLTSGGYPFARDLVLTPALPLRPEALGLGTGSPRAAPLDAVVAVLSTVVDGGVVGRVAVVGVLLAAGMAGHRAVRGLGVAPRALAGALAVWNPFVVERLGLGQWALLAGYAAVLGVLAVVRPGRDAGRRGTAARVAPWLLLGALTPTGALLAGAAAVVLAVRHRRDVGVVVLAGLVQLPWLLPALLGGAGAVSDPAAVAAFAARAERPGPALLSLVGLGGIWDGQSVPGSRTGWLGHLTAGLVVVVLVVAARRSGAGPARPSGRLWALGLGSLALAALTSLPVAGEVVADLTAVVPGLGLLRDAQKWLAAFVALAVVAAAVTADRLLRLVRRRAGALAPTALVLVVVAPFALLPDATVVVHRVLTPVAYPTELGRAAEVVAADPGLVASTPWRLYRTFAWAGPYTTYDPASRWLDARVVTSDDLVLADRVVRGEDPLAARIGSLVDDPGPGTAEGLAALGVRWVLVALDDPAAPDLLDALLATSGTEPAVEGPAFVLLGVTGTDDRAGAALEVPGWRVALVAAVDLLVLLVTLVVARPRSSRGGRSGSVTVA
ncbi:hypothetical protein ACK8HX_13370 [Oryzobacter sp. R7]|uniref:hypothetical protein n=1 Tax=Oryzobacter faecalis TaxID=3388656 RepID=UPI00398CFBBD